MTASVDPAIVARVKAGPSAERAGFLRPAVTRARQSAYRARAAAPLEAHELSVLLFAGDWTASRGAPAWRALKTPD